MTDLINAFIKEGLLTKEQLSEARCKQIGAKRPLGELVIEMGFVWEKKMRQRCLQSSLRCL
ncbi:hypothetical protein ACFLUV_03875 [Elusimicrobiota bacterium]